MAHDTRHVPNPDGSPEAWIAVIDELPIVAGDYNGDGTVNATDYPVWRNNVCALAGTLPNHTDGDEIGQAQYDTWKANFGSTAMGSGTTQNYAAPEPSSALYLGGHVIA